MKTESNSLVWIIKNGEPKEALLINSVDEQSEADNYNILVDGEIFMYHKKLVYSDLKSCLNASLRQCSGFVLHNYF